MDGSQKHPIYSFESIFLTAPFNISHWITSGPSIEGLRISPSSNHATTKVPDTLLVGLAEILCQHVGLDLWVYLSTMVAGYGGWKKNLKQIPQTNPKKHVPKMLLVKRKHVPPNMWLPNGIEYTHIPTKTPICLLVLKSTSMIAWCFFMCFSSKTSETWTTATSPTFWCCFGMCQRRFLWDLACWGLWGETAVKSAFFLEISRWVLCCNHFFLFKQLRKIWI